VRNYCSPHITPHYETPGFASACIIGLLNAVCRQSLTELQGSEPKAAVQTRINECRIAYTKFNSCTYPHRENSYAINEHRQTSGCTYVYKKPTEPHDNSSTFRELYSLISKPGGKTCFQSLRAIDIGLIRLHLPSDSVACRRWRNCSPWPCNVWAKQSSKML